MFSRKLAGIAFAASCVLLPARATTVDTFSFTQVGWFDFQTGTVGASEPEITVTGSFTGTVETGGLIELGDLNSFLVQFDVASLGPIEDEPLANLTLFSYLTTGGASSLDFAGSMSLPTNICMGAAVSLDAECNSNFTVFYPAGTFGVTEANGMPIVISMSQPQITLISSVTTTAPTTPPATTPEPATIFLTGPALLGVGIFLQRRAPS